MFLEQDNKAGKGPKGNQRRDDWKEGLERPKEDQKEGSGDMAPR